ncbi:MAG: type I-E CRISPR-associated protein Cse1/CasA, partial [Candidatus Aureabacteria bacterium]|nr:type I-E CRISPR-associated protein Cse1/CasA [Candidatus Auribacterota bacterium]
MNLSGDPWIPILRLDGIRETVGLDKLFLQAPRFRDLAVGPIQRIALMRLLICIAQAALDGPSDIKEWKACAEVLGEAAHLYLERYCDRFELFAGPQPFLRLPGIEHNRNARVDKLDFDLASGQNPTLFDREALTGDRTHLPPAMALLLLTYQCFSPGGTIGTTLWDGAETVRYCEQAPGSEGSPLHTLIQGDTLLETIRLNLVPKDRLKRLGIEFGRPIWDRYPRNPAEVTREMTCSYLGRLVPVSRAIVIEDGKPYCTLAAGITYPKLPSGRDPLLTVLIRKGKGGQEIPGYLRCDPGRHSWRDLGSILSLSRTLD